MTLVQFLRLVARHLNFMLLAGLVAAVTVFWLTRNSPKEYQTYSIINTGLVSGYNIENSNGGRIDYAYTNNEIENILGIVRSRETLEELNARLLADALILERPDKAKLTNTSFANLQEILPSAIRQTVLVAGDVEKTLANVKALRDQEGENPVKKLLLSDHPLFGIEHLQTIVAKREGTSDMIRISYTTTDPAVCQRTISELIGLFTEKHRSIKEGQSSNVLAFFEQATKESATELAGKEDDMLAFMVNNKIINYYEQTRFIAAKKEDLDELYFKELMSLAAADSSRRNLEDQLGKRVNLPELNKNLMAQREMLAGLSTQLATLEIGNLTDSIPKPGNDRVISDLRTQSERLKLSVRNTAEATYANQRSTEGVETKTLLTRWLDQWLGVEQTLARLEVFRERKSEFDRIYSRFAPWGSKIKRLEREIDVSEKAYLENLHSYNQARLHKHNMLMSTNLRVVDMPFFPEKPNSSKRAMLVIVAGLAGFIIVLAIALAFELLDNTLNNPEQAAETTGLALAAAFPALPSKWQEDDQMDYPFLMRRSAEQLLQRIQLDVRKQGLSNHPPKVLLLSTRSGEGKSMLRDYILQMPDQSANHFEWIEVPALLAGSYPVEAMAQADVAILVASAGRTWNAADIRALSMAEEVLGKPCRLVLNNVRPDRLESALGEVPKKRSALRRWVKKIATLNFSKK